jgi:hypothetical protein
MGRAEPRRLLIGSRLGGRLTDEAADLSGIRPDDDRESVGTGSPRGAYDMTEHRPAPHLVHHLGHRGTHPRPLAGRKDDRKAAPLRHGSLSLVGLAAFSAIPAESVIVRD